MRKSSSARPANVHVPPRHQLHPARPLRTNPVPQWQRNLLDWPLLALMATGLGWIAVHYSIGAGTADGLPHPAEPWLMRLHGLGGFLALLALGSFFSLHISRGWRGHQRRSSAIVLLIAWAVAISTAWMLYYAAPEDWREAIGLAHAGVGVVLGGLLLLHRRIPSAAAN